MIIEMMKTYVELTPPSQKVVQEWFQKTYQTAKAKETASCELKQNTSIPQKSDINERIKAYHDYLETQEKATGKLSS